MTKEFIIIDNINGQDCCTIIARSEKAALIKFRNGLLSSGFYTITRENKRYYLRSSYGSEFIAKFNCYA